MKTQSQVINGIIAGVLELLVGILLLVNPENFTAGILVVGGILLCLLGLRYVIRYFRSCAEEAAARNDLTAGLCCIVAGCFCSFGSQLIMDAFSMLTVIYGVAILVTSLEEIQSAVDLLRLRHSRWWLAGISALVSLVCAVVILYDPFRSMDALWTFTGVTLIVEAVMDVVVIIFSRPPKHDPGQEVAIIE